MHYGANFFSKNGDNTINPKNYHSIHPNEIGDAYYSYSGPVLSKIDILKTNLLYRCSKVSGMTSFIITVLPFLNAALQ